MSWDARVAIQEHALCMLEGAAKEGIIHIEYSCILCGNKQITWLPKCTLEKERINDATVICTLSCPDSRIRIVLSSPTEYMRLPEPYYVVRSYDVVSDRNLTDDAVFYLPCLRTDNKCGKCHPLQPLQFVAPVVEQVAPYTPTVEPLSAEVDAFLAERTVVGGSVNFLTLYNVYFDHHDGRPSLGLRAFVADVRRRPNVKTVRRASGNKFVGLCLK